ncbi:haloacid dehalogenase [Colletotrichum truncatum]|uniref:Haloacid dehalogenase n=1 Tax=Colletotrichum truncatum TaxID=5467 RepID=A0ACC3YTY5_COLTU|nr:haloacid dehalogenase [Colletotrichum truncatum]KAF6798609.1 haloacid dehalogenase [Colletotrichum truncatum]
MTYPDLTTFKGLSFDCYGTLIDWESGLLAGLEPIISRLPSDDPHHAQKPDLLAQRFDKLSSDLQVSEPGLRYNVNLARSFSSLASELGVSVSEDEARRFGELPGTWAPFPDTVAGLAVLKQHYDKLIILSNIDEDNISSTLEHFRPQVEFDAVYTAQRIGSYKPSRRNFEFLFEHVEEELGVAFGKGELLHVARSLTADHVPAKQLGFRSVWISRGGETKEGEGVGGDYDKLKGDVAFEWRFDTIGEFAEEVDRQFREKAL